MVASEPTEKTLRWLSEVQHRNPGVERHEALQVQYNHPDRGWSTLEAFDVSTSELMEANFDAINAAYAQVREAGHPARILRCTATLETYVFREEGL